jgi:hypothetical protein
VRKAWDEKKSLNDNLSSMGLVADPNSHKNFKILSGKVSKAKRITIIFGISEKEGGIACVVHESDILLILDVIRNSSRKI